MAGHAKAISLLLVLALILVIDRVQTNASINPYKVLGLSRNADERQIRNAYRKMAKEWHPDINKSPEAHEKFMQINQAYEVSSIGHSLEVTSCSNELTLFYSLLDLERLGTPIHVRRVRDNKRAASGWRRISTRKL